jgi:hypothetical protein
MRLLPICGSVLLALRVVSKRQGFFLSAQAEERDVAVTTLTDNNEG